MKKTLILLLFVSSLIFGQQENKKDHYEHGQLRADINYVDGVRHGLCTYYWQTGTIFSIGTFNNGKLEGLLKCYFKEGALKSEEYFKNGSKEGNCKYYYENGALQREGIYKNDLPVGKVKVYDKFGKELHDDC